jgi:hypothetical protein
MPHSRPSRALAVHPVPCAHVGPSHLPRLRMHAAEASIDLKRPHGGTPSSSNRESAAYETCTLLDLHMKHLNKTLQHTSKTDELETYA